MFRESALKGMIAAGTYTKERVECIHNLQVKEDDANPKYSKEIVKKYTKCVVVVIMHFQKNGISQDVKRDYIIYKWEGVYVLISM